MNESKEYQLKHSKDIHGQMLLEYSQPDGLNGDCEGGVQFMKDSCLGVPLQSDKLFQPIKPSIERQ